MYLQFCAMFGENVVYPWDDFIKMPWKTIQDIIEQRSIINEEKQKRIEEKINEAKGKKKL